MKTNTKNTIIAILSLIAFLLLGYIFYHQKDMMQPESIRTSTDTIYIHSIDTLRITKDSIVYKDRIIIDSVYVHDTVLVREQIHYQDSIADIYVSGIEPEIDSIMYKLRRDTVVVTNEIEKTFIKKQKIGLVWCVGAYTGYGAQLNNGLVRTGWEIGVGASIGLGGIIK